MKQKVRIFENFNFVIHLKMFETKFLRSSTITGKHKIKIFEHCSEIF